MPLCLTLHIAEAASLYAKEVSTKEALAIAQHLPEGSQLLRFYNDENLYPQSFDTIRQQAHAILPAEKLDALCDYLARKPNSQQDHQWIYYTEQHKTISKNLRPLCMAVDFTYGSSSKTLETAVNFLKNVFAKKQSLSKQAINTFPTAFIPAAIKPYIVTDEDIDVYRYECCVYLQLAARLNNGLVTCDDSTQYRDFNTEIKEAVNWEDEAVRAEIIAQLDVDELSLSGDELVKLYEQDINTLYDTVNADILSGKNKAIKLTLQDEEVHDWRLPYRALNDEYNHTFYNQVPRVSLSTVLEFADAHTDMLAECIPLKSYGFKTPLHKGALNACITANATDLGTFKMSEICNLNYNLLYRTNRSRVRCDTLQAANDNIIYHFTQLGIYPHYTIADDIAWMSVDGQKFKTARDTFKARHSPKYYGLGKGVVAYSGIMNNIALVTRMIGANEHESHHLNALTQDISREITINRLASDTEGSNKVNYVLLRGHKIDYTPCYKTLKKRAAALVSFRSVDYYNRNQYVIKPHEKIKTALITRNWDKVKPILAAIWTQGVESSTIVKKLCMQKQKNSVKEALFAYNNILRTRHILRYISDEDYRRYIRRALNRGEAYHLLRRKIAEAHGGKFRGGSDDEIAIWNECGRLIANAIIFYNAYMLSALLKKMEAEGNTEAAEFIKKLSPIACQHINFNGLFEFKPGENPVDIEEMVNKLGEIVQAAVGK